MFDLAKVSSKGQVTIPVDIRRKLKLKEGDKVLFMAEGDRVFLANASLVALKDMQQAMKGLAEKQGLVSEADVSRLVKEVRKELWEQRHEGND
ncbi:MAG: AbrB/MazE/SpoVT family DNA-binding domain-containing protein [Firmicutes bacterium]|nr:AbrB/MazE/SpoVT family DNA-binding domain-containing protein [Bacillota bacterium]